MPLQSIPAVFMRGGTSRAVMFHARDLPDRAEWDPIFLAAMGSPDPNGRQLNGMGGGISSLSKVCILAPSDRADADIDYTFAQVQIRDPRVDYRSNCGNMSSAVGPFAVDEGIVRPNGDSAVVRIFNTNTRKIIRSTFPLEDGRAATDGDLAIPGVAGTGAPVRLDFLAPGGATTGRLLPTGKPTDRLDLPDIGSIEVSLVDAANACVFVHARGSWPDRARAAGGTRARPRSAGATAVYPASGLDRDGHRTRRCRGAHCRRGPDHRICCATNGCADAVGRSDRGSAGRPDGAVPVERPAAPRAAVDGLAMHRGGGQYRWNAGGRGAGTRRRRAGTDRHALRHPDGGSGSRARTPPANGWRIAARSIAPRGGCSTAASTSRVRTYPAPSCSHGSVAQSLASSARSPSASVVQVAPSRQLETNPLLSAVVVELRVLHHLLQCATKPHRDRIGQPGRRRQAAPDHG